MSRVFWLQGRGVRALEEANEALRLVPKDEPNAAHAEILWGVASQQMLNSQSSDSIETAREALQAARITGIERVELGALIVLATSMGSLGEMAESNRYFEQLDERAQSSGILRPQLVRYVNQGETLAENGLVVEALELTERGIVRTRQLGLGRWEAALRSNAARFLFRLSRWDEVAEHLTAMTPSLDVDLPQIHVSLASLSLAAERGDKVTTQRELDRLGSLRVDDMHAELQGPYWASRASDLRWRGKYAQAYELASEALTAIDRPETWMYMADVAAHAIETVADAAEAGRSEPDWIDRAVEWHARFAQFSGDARRYQRLAATATADLARSQGRNSPGLWRTAIAAWDEAPYWRAKCQWRLAQSLGDLEDPEVRLLIEEAGGVAEELKAQPLLDAVHALGRLRSLG
jgi:tetratricopeptide (TPR) repeat protein